LTEEGVTTHWGQVTVAATLDICHNKIDTKFKVGHDYEIMDFKVSGQDLIKMGTATRNE